MADTRAIAAVFEDGVFRPLVEVNLPERRRVSIIVSPLDELAPELIAEAAELGGGFAFLANPAEDVYSLEDGEAV